MFFFKEDPFCCNLQQKGEGNGACWSLALHTLLSNSEKIKSVNYKYVRIRCSQLMKRDVGIIST